MAQFLIFEDDDLVSSLSSIDSGSIELEDDDVPCHEEYLEVPLIQKVPSLWQ